ncbi:AAA family ATPase [Methanoculleus sp. FWC-SCC1]|uniref:polynucleotide 5'-hydroxyl-kinase n=1 Tax=Methanoculleus frigidifontis TaxID=2584085 RepID=A0ABT8M7G4_9EURY|nr:polynucleotide 5'-hydroxyl-kinase [Methanoculleus sp. FWC-SCC1]MDN7023872.1 AAA family ATPase [Methanoculleus sp. FWC-SCC1]
MNDPGLSIGEGWQDLVTVLASEPAPQRTYIIGGTDSGKSTLCRYLTRELNAYGTTAYIDCDTGQSAIGPPTTVGLAITDRNVPATSLLRFVGATSPRGHLLQTLTGAKRLLETAVSAGASAVILDSPGYISGDAAFEFQFQMIDLLQPDHIVALQRGRELERLLANFRRHPGIRIHRLGISPAVITRPPAERRRYREEKFRAYFVGAEVHEVSLRRLGLHGRVPDLRKPVQVHRRLVALCDRWNFAIALGVIGSADPETRRMQVLMPPVDRSRAASIQFGSLYLDLAAPPGEMESYSPFEATRG